MKIEDLGLSVRPYNVLKRAGIYTVEQLQQMTDDDLMRLRNMGMHSLAEIREKVAYVKTMTNADRIRAMSDEELAEYLVYHNPYHTESNCLKWLRQTAEEVPHES